MLIGLNPDFLDMQPTDLIPLKDDNGSKGGGASTSSSTVATEEAKAKEEDSGKDKKVPAGEHPQYGKFFKMLKVGIPLPAVKAKVTLEGLNPDVMDKSPDEMILLNDVKDDKNKKDGDVKMVKVSEHPKYAKFFKMLKIGLPLGE